MSAEHKQHCPPRVKCPEVGEKGSRITYASSRNLQLKVKETNSLLQHVLTFSALEGQKIACADLKHL